MDEYNADWIYSAELHNSLNEKPVYTGVFSWWSLAEFVLDELIDSGIDVNYEDFLASIEDLPEDEQQKEMDYYQSEDTHVLVGFILADDDVYDIDPTAEFSAIVSNSNGCPTVQVVQSKHYKHVRSFCSPCYPNQLDGDSGFGSYICYSLPPDMLSPDDEDF